MKPGAGRPGRARHKRYGAFVFPIHLDFAGYVCTTKFWRWQWSKPGIHTLKHRLQKAERDEDEVKKKKKSKFNFFVLLSYAV